MGTGVKEGRGRPLSLVACLVACGLLDRRRQGVPPSPLWWLVWWLVVYWIAADAPRSFANASKLIAPHYQAPRWMLVATGWMLARQRVFHGLNAND